MRDMAEIRDFLLRHRLCADAFDWEAELERFDCYLAGLKRRLKIPR
jgi:hypothetical protein